MTTEEVHKKIQDLNEQIIARQAAQIKCLEALCVSILRDYRRLYESVFGKEKNERT